jgi:hypothetical protein
VCDSSTIIHRPATEHKFNYNRTSMPNEFFIQQ